MGAIVLDASKVNSFVLPNLNKSKSNIQDAYSTSILLKNNIPSSFNYKSTINEIVNQIYEIKREINDISGIINNKLDYAKKIETKTESRANSVASLASSIGSVVEAIGGATIGSATGGIVSASVDAKVGSSVSKNIVKTGAKTTKGFVSGVKKIGSSILNGLKKTGSKIVSGVKTAANWVKDTTKTVTNWVSDKFNAVKDWTSKALKDTGAWISKTAKATWSWIEGAASTVWTHMKKIGASFVNGVLSLVKGLIRLVESLGDLVILLGSGLATCCTPLYDIGKGLCTGKWDWSATKGLWKKTKAVVAYDWTSKCIFDPLYNSKFGKWLDNNAYGWFKSDGIGCQILDGVGYVAGVIAISCVTFGAGGVALAAPTAASMAATATVAGIGKYTAEEWNKNSLSITYGDQEINLAIDYEKYSEIEKLKDGQSTTITQQLIGEDGKTFELKFTITKKGDTYSIVDSAGNVAKFNGVVESNTAKGLLVGGIKGAWEGAQYYVGGKIGASNFGKITNSITNPTTQVLARSGIRVGLDTLTGVAEVPFQSLVTMFSENKNWNEAWEASGGWKAVGTQAGIAGLMSLIGEGVSLKRNLNVTKAGKELDEFFQKHRSGQSGYGSDQGITKKIVDLTFEQTDNIKNSAYFGQFKHMRDKLVQMGLGSFDAIMLLKEMDSAGVCSYASVCNEIFDSFRKNPEAFESIFGFPMFTTLENGAKVLNSSELLVDLFIFENSASNGGSIFYNTPTGDLVMDKSVFENPELLGKTQKYMSDSIGQNDSAINAYLKSKNSNLEYSSTTLNNTSVKYDYSNFSKMNKYEIDSLKQNIEMALSNKKQLSLGIYQHKDSPYSIKMKSMDTGLILNTKNWNEGGGHAVFITGSNNKGVFVSSWGEKYFISYDDLSYAPFVLTESTITGF